MEILLYLLLVAAGVAYLVWFFRRIVTTKKKKDALVASAEAKDPFEWTDEERREMLYRLEMQKSQLTYSQYTALKAKYEGRVLNQYEQEFLLKMGIEETKQSTAKMQKEIKDNLAAREIVKDAAIGGAIAGPTGAVVGAIVGKAKTEGK